MVFLIFSCLMVYQVLNAGRARQVLADREGTGLEGQAKAGYARWNRAQAFKAMPRHQRYSPSLRENSLEKSTAGIVALGMRQGGGSRLPASIPWQTGSVSALPEDSVSVRSCMARAGQAMSMRYDWRHAPCRSNHTPLSSRNAMPDQAIGFFILRAAPE